MRRLHQRIPELAGSLTDLVKDSTPDFSGAPRERLQRAMRLGLGIRPSSTISSNFVTSTPIYSAACARDKPRGGSEGGKQLDEFASIDLCHRADDRGNGCSMHSGFVIATNGSSERSGSAKPQIAELRPVYLYKLRSWPADE
jgi:hypothetical protein